MFGKGKRSRLFFATDLHGCDCCFNKWLAAAKAYDADSLILGGDVTGKLLVPFTVDEDGSWAGSLSGRAVSGTGREELERVAGMVANSGNYLLEVSVAERARLSEEPGALEAAFEAAARDRLGQWVERADHRLSDQGVDAVAILGNDDEPGFTEVLASSARIRFGEGAVIELAGGYEVVSVGYSNPTPWDTPREVGEDELEAMLEEAVAPVSEMATAIFNFHCPPFDTHLDRAPKLDADLRPMAGVDGAQVAPVGSRAVRRVIERHQPLLALHGHVHESPGAQRIGRTLCVNPGSDYGQGILRGAIVTFDEKRGDVKGWQLIHG